ncbi:SRPBCC family protein [Streptomyces sp. ISL-94]|uniref:aromatase/cyclase n=1 Tax=Streptomyces sp. ISL-94 TaxID=2819190 RepID=UPI001BE5E2D8|nr:SRPBCC family protein [Streptomyces sp. ISL-94]MBT2479889.1 SRPBCC family protein [Streptomyces sp. ISL-94]
MSSQRVHASERTAWIAAPAGVVYGLLADAVRWPLLLPAPVHVERMDFDGVRERLRLWDVAGERVRSFHLRRVLHPRSRTVEFEQEDTARPGAHTTGTWAVEARGAAACLVTLRQERTLEGLPAAGTERSRQEWEAEPAERLAHLKAVAERWERLDELLLSFEDSVHVDGPAELVYDFLHRIADWPERVPHVESASVIEDVPGVQVAAVDTCATPDGRTIATKAVRLCFPSAARIVYKELVTPEPIAAHTGEWSLIPDGDGVRVVCAQQVMLREEAGTELVEARRYVRTWLGRASTETLRLAKWRAQTTVRRLR